MNGRHGSLWFGICLRGAGLILMTSAWFEGLRLFTWVQADSGGMWISSELPLGMLAYVSATCGAALVIVGPHLLDRIAVSARWSRVVAEPVDRLSLTPQAGR